MEMEQATETLKKYVDIKDGKSEEYLVTDLSQELYSFISHFCQTQFQLASSVEFELRLALILIISAPPLTKLVKEPSKYAENLVSLMLSVTFFFSGFIDIF